MRTPAARAAFAPSKTYIIVGGTGGIGSSIAEWMLTRGARKILLFGMSGHEGRSVRYLMAKAASYKASVKAIRCDITSSRDVDRVIGSDDLDGIGGIVHCAMGLSVCLSSWLFPIDTKSRIGEALHPNVGRILAYWDKCKGERCVEHS